MIVLSKIVRLFSFVILSFLFVDNVCSAEAVKIVTDKYDAIYNVSEKAIFEISSEISIDFRYYLTVDGEQIIDSGIKKINGESIKIETTLEEPGFLNCRVEYAEPDTGDIKNVIAGAAFDPLGITPAYESIPDDFISFWDARKSELRSVPMSPVIKQTTSSNPDIEIFDVQINSIGLPVSGYFAKPKNAKPKSSPAILFLQGAGVYSASKGAITEYASKGFIAYEINAHGVPNGKSNSYYDDLFSGQLAGYWEWGKENPYVSYFTGMCIRVVRALDFLKSQPEWDGKILIAYGSSQGGFQALVGAGLDKDVNVVMASVPAMCDHSGKVSGWPRFISMGNDNIQRKQIEDASKYLDSVNFSRLCKAYGIFSVGFIDVTCRPTTVYAAFNSFNGKKEIVNKPLMGHEFPKCDRDVVDQKIFDYVKKVQSIK